VSKRLQVSCGRTALCGAMELDWTGTPYHVLVIFYIHIYLLCFDMMEDEWKGRMRFLRG
jgi:hypothetical protein